MIRLAHDHPEGKICYVLGHRGHPLTKPGLFRSVDPFSFVATTFTAAYLAYSGHWYAYDNDGRELASFSQAFYDSVIVNLRVGDLATDPDCQP